MKRLLLFFIILAIILSGCAKESKIEMILNTGQDTVEINSEWNDPGAILKVGSELYNATSNGDVDVSTFGLYEIEYSYEYKGKIYKTTRYVNIVDQTKPDITLNAGIDTIKKGESWIDAEASATDNSNEQIDLTVLGDVNINILGTYEILYTATDSSGNKAEVIRYVHVVE